MSIKITIYDGAIPMLDKIASISYGLGLDALDQAGIELREQTRRAFGMSGSHKWTFKINKKGKRTIVKSEANQVFGRRLSHRTARKYRPDSMKNFVTSFLDERHMLMVVGGQHKSFRPKKRREGKVVGTLARVSGITDATHAILRKLNDGGRVDEEYHKETRGGKSIEGFSNAYYKPRRFFQKGRARAMPKVRHIMTSKLEMLIAKQVNRVDVRTKVRAS